MKWAAIQYPITYNNVFDADIQKLPKTYTIEQEVYPEAISRKGYDFYVWNPPLIPKGEIGAKSFSASWRIKSYLINYELNGGSIENQQIAYTIESADYTPPTPSKTGYKFKSWSPSSIPQGSVGDKTFTADWEVEQYEIEYANTYDANVSSLPKSYTIEQVVTPSAISRSGWTFNGWNPASIAQGSTGNKKFSASWTALPVGYQIPDCGDFYLNPGGGFDMKLVDVHADRVPADSIPSSRQDFGKVAITASIVNGKAQLKIENTYQSSDKCSYRANVIVTYGRGSGAYTVTKNIVVKGGLPLTVTI